MAKGNIYRDSINLGSEEYLEESLRESLIVSSDEHLDKCVTCSKDGKSVSALKYCVECDHNLCLTCLNQHNKFDLMKGHRILDISVLDRETARTVEVDLPTQRCGKHHGKLLDMYCKHHDVVCCGACIGLEHSTCKGIKYVPDVALAQASSEELQNVQRKLGYLQMRLTETISKQTKAVEKLTRKKEGILQQVRDIRTQINRHLDNLESKVTKNVNDSFATSIDSINNTIKKMAETIQLLRQQEQELERVKKIENKSSLYVETKGASKYIKSSTKFANDLERLPPKSFTFEQNPKVSELLKELKSFGQLHQDSSLLMISPLESIPIRVKEDRLKCDISDFCLMGNGTALLTDHENKCLKRLDNNNSISERLKLPGKPYGICIVDDSVAAVTLHMLKKVQLVTTSSKMALQSSFSVGDHCRGIAHYKGLLYVCCGGWKAENEGPGHVEVYTTSGALMRSFDQHLSIPLHITIMNQEHAQWLCIADSDNGLIMMTRKGYIENIFTHKDMLNYTGVCLGPDNQIFVTGLNSNTVALLAADGQYAGTVLTKKEGLKEPQSLFYDKENLKLYVTMVDNDDLKAFDVKYTETI